MNQSRPEAWALSERLRASEAKVDDLENTVEGLRAALQRYHFVIDDILKALEDIRQFDVPVMPHYSPALDRRIC